MRTKCSREIFTKKCQQQQIFDSDLKGAWHYNHVTFTPIAKKFMLYCRLIYMVPNLCVRLTIKVKVGIPESFKVGWYSPKKTGSSHLKSHFIHGSIKKFQRGFGSQLLRPLSARPIKTKALSSDQFPNILLIRK